MGGSESATPVEISDALDGPEPPVNDASASARSPSSAGMPDVISGQETNHRVGIVAVRPEDWLHHISLRDIVELQRDLRLEFSLMKQLSAATPPRRPPSSVRSGSKELLEPTATDSSEHQSSRGITVVSGPPGPVFLAAAGPKRRGASELWRSVLQHEVRRVFMLCGEGECSEYLPSTTEPTQLRGATDCDPDIEVSLLSPDASSGALPPGVPGLCHRCLRVRSADRDMRVDHFHYCFWPDHDVPPLDAVLALESLVSPGSLGAILVHCRAGLGRTGAFVALCLTLDSVRRQLADHPQRMPTLSVLRTVLELRAHRAGMVQTLDQYRLIYDTLALASRRLVSESSMLTLSDPQAPRAEGVQHLSQESTACSGSDGTSTEISMSEEMPRPCH